MKLSQGEYVALERVEALYSGCQGVLQIYVHGDSLQSYLIAVMVPDPVFLADTRRPFAKWELAVIVQLPEAEAKEVVPGMEETVAETFDKNGKVMGRWIVKWRENGEGICRGQGWIVRYVGFYNAPQ